MKKIKALAIILSMALLAGCSLFAQPSETSGDGEKKEGVLEIKLSDDVTIADPEGLEYDERYVLHADSSNPLVQFYASMGSTINEQYIVIYGKEEKILGEYTYCVFADEASAQAMVGMVPTMEIKGLIGVLVQDTNVLEGSIAQLIAAQMMTGETAADYANYYKDTYTFAEMEIGK